jgi:hypothetical protein
MNLSIYLSMNVLDSFLWFQVEVVLFYKDSGQDCPFLRLVCWIAWQWVLLFPIGQLSSGYLSPGFLSGVNPREQVGSKKWFCERLANDQ